MPEHSTADRAWALDQLRRLFAATNLMIPGSSFEVVGHGSRAEALRRAFRRFGALPAADSPRFRFAVDDAGAASAVVGGSPIELSGRRRGASDRIAWAFDFMPVTTSAVDRLADSGLPRGRRIGISMVLEPKTAVLALALHRAGAAVTVFAHPDETDDAVAAALRELGVPVFASRRATPAEHRALALAFLDDRPEILVDDGAHLIRLAHEERPALVEELLGAAEETTSGVRALRVMAAQGILRTPVIAVNDARSKTSFDNRYGTGFSCVFAILNLVGVPLPASTTLVIGYGPVGEGVAHYLRAADIEVVVSELDPVRALAARFDGFRVAETADAVRTAGLVISATGVEGTVPAELLAHCADGAVVAVAGGVPDEVGVERAIREGARLVRVSDGVERLSFDDGHSVTILGGAGAVNITAGEGNPIDIMDLSFAAQVAAIAQLLEAPARLPVGIHTISAREDSAVAAVALGWPVANGAASDSESAEWRTTRFTREPEADG
ncbi:adenosylhomocysteinase [Galbitalea soli]|uniref:Adenosylhomocysteinase n=1 Tax=Galbitalea soli TaxID=1268042 RepID=A0A7C9TQC8_9MICO|nr:adenosylhomocysteinase [Galbitalea soli]NEM90919.1 adenosylhomocysteinase [Galbitalea soli]NYJ29605.1 adenosylhomocysteinase [Galbitalea soli]